MIVYAGGSFDLFHYGHVRFLRRCRDLAGPRESERLGIGAVGNPMILNRVVVSLNTDEFITSYKGRPPIIPYDGRREILEACRYVDEVVPNVGGADSRPAIALVEPNIVAVGSDWADRDYHGQMGFTPEWLAERGIRLVYFPYTAGIAASMIRAAAGAA